MADPLHAGPHPPPHRSLPTVWAAHQGGELDLEQVRMIDRVARRATEPGTLAALDEHAVDATLTAAARHLGADDPRSQQQRRADLFTDLLLGRLLFTDRGSTTNPPAVPNRDPEPEAAEPERRAGRRVPTTLPTPTRPPTTTPWRRAAG